MKYVKQIAFLMALIAIFHHNHFAKCEQQFTTMCYSSESLYFATAVNVPKEYKIITVYLHGEYITQAYFFESTVDLKEIEQAENMRELALIAQDDLSVEYWNLYLANIPITYGIRPYQGITLRTRLIEGVVLREWQASCAK